MMTVTGRCTNCSKMTFQLSPLYLLILVAYAACLQVNSAISSNQTDTWTNCTSENCTEPSGPSNVPTRSPPPFWCPVGFQLLYNNERWTHACRPRSCPGRSEEAHKNCIKPSKDLKTCPKIALKDDQYYIDDSGNLVDLQNNNSIELGSYVLEATKAIVCDPNGNDTTVEPFDRPELPQWCMPLEVAMGDFTQSQEKLFVPSIGLHVDLFTVEPNGTAHVCLKLSRQLTETCQLGLLPGHEFEVLPDWGLRHHVNILDPVVYDRGHYILADDKSFALICIFPSEPLAKGALYGYAVASLLSAFCLLLALVAHLFFPALNYHAKALMCLAFSFLVMYVALAVRYFSGNFETPAANLVMFSVHYIFALGAFFWLSILSFDLWRVFSNLRGTITSAEAARNRRIFIAKCIYAWGIPIVLCIVIIAIEFSPDVQKSLGLNLQLQSMNWMNDTTSNLIFYCTPLIIILLENITFFVLTVVNLRNASKGSKILKSNVNKKLFRVYVKLFLVMGICWFFEVISFLAKHKTKPEVWYATDIINALQGVFIFIIYVCKKKTLKIFKHRFGYITTSQMNTTTSSTQEGIKMDSVPLSNAQSNESNKPCASTVEKCDLLSDQKY